VLVETPPRPKRGRPSIEACRRLAASVTIRFKPAEYDAIYRAAVRDRSSVADLLRKALRRHGRI
jgi:hypothetical protein